MLEGNVCVAEIIDLWPATGIISYPYDAVQRIWTNSRLCVGALEFTSDLLYRTVQWSIFGTGQKLVPYANYLPSRFARGLVAWTSLRIHLHDPRVYTHCPTALETDMTENSYLASHFARGSVAQLASMVFCAPCL